MKKYFMILLSAVLILSLVGVVSADDLTAEDISKGKDNTTAIVKLVVSDSYTVTLPSAFNFGYSNDAGTYTARSPVSVSIKTFDSAMVLNISVSGNTSVHDTKLWNLTCIEDNNMYVAYYYMTNVTGYDNHIEDVSTDARLVHNGGSILITNKTVSDKYIHLRLDGTPTHSGTYTETLTFKVNIDPLS